MAKIFTPLQIKGVQFKNRIVMAPMVRFGFSCDHGIMGPRLMQEYLDRADQQIGLLITQALSVTAVAPTGDRAGAYDKQQLFYLQQLASACHQHGSRIFAQLTLPGYGWKRADSGDINSLTVEELDQIRDKFLYSARLCQEAGLDGVELHGAHTFFLNMLSSAEVNHRQDAYGGTLSARLHLAEEIVKGIKQFAGANFLVSYRMGWTASLEEDVQTAQLLEQFGLDLLHVSSGIPRERQVALPPVYDYNQIVYTGSCIKKHLHIPVIVVNDLKTLARGEKLLADRNCDFVAYGRPFLADGAFVVHSLENLDYQPCYGCKECQWFTDGEQCPARKKLGR